MFASSLAGKSAPAYGEDGSTHHGLRDAADRVQYILQAGGELTCAQSKLRGCLTSVEEINTKLSVQEARRQSKTVSPKPVDMFLEGFQLLALALAES